MAEAVNDPAAWGATPAAVAASPADWGAHPITQFGALMEGVKSGSTAGFSDELTGLYHASGIPKILDGLDPSARKGAIRNLVSMLGGGDIPALDAIDPQAPVKAAGNLASMAIGGGRLAYEKLTGNPGEATQTYETERDKARAVSKNAREQYPKTFLGGEVGGALAVPVGGAAQGATLPARIARGAAVGAGFGGVSGFGEGEGLQDSATRGAIGTVAGGLTGGVGTPIVEGVIQGARHLATPITSAVRGLMRPDDEAARRIASAITRDQRAGDAGLTPTEFNATSNAGYPVAVVDQGGSTTRALARSSANTSPEGRGALERMTSDRFEGQSGRIADWMNTRLNFPDANATQKAIDQVSGTVNKANYARAHRDPGAQSMWDEGFEQIMQAPVVQEAARGATTTGANRAAVQGFTPVRKPFEFHDTDSLTPRYSQRVDDQGQTIPPNLDFWDHVKRNLDDKISTLQRAGENSAARDAQQLRSALVNHLDELVPSYAQARAGAAQLFGAENALEAGQNFVGASERFGLPAARDALAKMSNEERQLFQDGYASRFIEKVLSTNDRRNVLDKIARSPAARQELAMAVGSQRANELQTVLRVENIMDRMRGALGNSTTARQLIEAGLAGGATGAYTGDPTQAASVAGMVFALRAGGKLLNQRIDQNVARRVGEMLASPDPNILHRGVTMIANNPRLMRVLAAADGATAKAGGQQSANVPALQAAGFPRADEDKQNVPRPEGQ